MATEKECNLEILFYIKLSKFQITMKAHIKYKFQLKKKNLLKKRFQLKKYDN